VLKAYNRFQQYEQLLQEHWEIAKNLGEAEAEKVMEEYERKLKELQEEIGPI
jgi:ABC-type Fe3+-citrate transport system substrate-binding protein